MSRITDYVTFSIARITDVDRVMMFISKYFGKNHICACNKDFFLYEFTNGNHLNVLLAEDNNSKELYGIYAYYLYSCNDDKYDVAGGMSYVSDECKIPLVGTYLYEKIKDFYNVRSIVSVGMNKNTSYEINRRRKDVFLGSLSQFYMLSGNHNYKIATIGDEVLPHITEKDQRELVLFANSKQMYKLFESDFYMDRLPYKCREYVEHRYFNHPIYKYKLYGMETSFVLVCREVMTNGGKALRIVDLLGEASQFRHVGKALERLMHENDYEYIDFMEYGMDDDDVIAAGFSKLSLNGPNIIPNYFEPFEQRNIEVLCCASLRPALIFKADADQDRPSIIQ